MKAEAPQSARTSSIAAARRAGSGRLAKGGPQGSVLRRSLHRPRPRLIASRPSACYDCRVRSRAAKGRGGLADLIVVEDDGAVRELVTHVLERAGHAVRAAPDAATLHRLLSVRPPDLVVLDLTLPDGDGLSLARDLRGRGGDLGIVVLSALGEAMDRVAGLEVGADDYLAKPFEYDELVARVEVVLRRRRPGGPPRPRLGPWRVESDTARPVHDDGRALRPRARERGLGLAR